MSAKTTYFDEKLYQRMMNAAKMLFPDDEEAAAMRKLIKYSVRTTVEKVEKGELGKKDVQEKAEK